MRTRGAVGLVLLSATVALGPIAPATARDSRVPRIELWVGEHSRALEPWSSSWTYRQGPHCVTAQSDGIPGYEPELKVPGRRARPRLVLHKQARPQDVRITGYRRLGDDGAPTTRGRNYRSRLGPRIRGGAIKAWVARPHILVGDQLFLTLSVTWPDLSGCLPGRFDDTASWSFRLRRARD